MRSQRELYAHALQMGVHPSAVLESCVKLGQGVTIGALCSIGQQGFGLEPDATGRYLRIPHIGGVRIGDDVEIGALVKIARGTVDDTVIEEGVRIDDGVHIAHNVRIGRNSVVIAQAQISGSVQIGNDCYIGPGVTVRDQVKIGEQSFVGIGSNVVADVPPHVVVMGNPARIVRAR